MIEDDLRGFLDAQSDVPVYARYIPPEVPECLAVVENGGVHSTSSIRRSTHSISIESASTDRRKAKDRLNRARDYLTTQIPAEINGTHYYTAVPMADGNLLVKSPRGPTYIFHVTLEVVRQL